MILFIFILVEYQAEYKNKCLVTGDLSQSTLKTAKRFTE